jgi:hypothetical protein
MIIVSPRIVNFLGRILNAGKTIRAIAFFPFIFLRYKKDRYNKELINHEKIHIRQQIEMLVIFFHIWYLIGLYKKGYWGISFEKEAYIHEDDLDYLKKRKFWAFLKYIKNDTDIRSKDMRNNGKDKDSK